jgi:hypothetical protein
MARAESLNLLLKSLGSDSAPEKFKNSGSGTQLAGCHCHHSESCLEIFSLFKAILMAEQKIPLFLLYRFACPVCIENNFQTDCNPLD